MGDFNMIMCLREMTQNFKLEYADTSRGNWNVSTQEIQWNLSITTTFKIKFITCDLFSNVF